MVSVCLYFQVHQPFRLRRYSIFDIGKSHDYFDHAKNQQVMHKIAKKCYLPANKLIMDLINRTDGKFKASYSITGPALEQFEQYTPEVLDSFKELAKTGNVEFLNETYYHTLSSIFSKQEFAEQIALHQRRIKELFGQKPKVFRNTELIFNNEIANFVQQLGFKGMLAEGADHVLGWRSPNFIYTPKTAPGMKLLLKNYRLSDDIAFRFSEKSWSEWPLTADKFANWVNAVNGNGDVVNLFMDYETFGEHQWEDKGIFDFLGHMPKELLRHPDNDFVTPSEAITKYPAMGELDVHHIVSWADVERDLSAWLGNRMQQEAVKELYAMEQDIKSLGSRKLLEDWRKLQISDHFYYMCTKWFNDGDVHKYFNPYDSPYEAFIAYMNIVNDFKMQLKEGKESAYRKASMEIDTLLKTNSKVNKYKNKGIKDNSLSRKSRDFRKSKVGNRKV
ncbi:polysaccharide deacetylase family protein [Candidatus Woesearchaeota archaeon]|nr:polysaccharide deacetylase family protein [Candidatus Woesearchaeota archaeon]